MSKKQSIKELTKILESYTECDDGLIEGVAIFTLDILHGKADHKRWLLQAALNFVNGDDIDDYGNVFKK